MSQQGDDMYQGPQVGLELWAAGARTQVVHEAHTPPAELLEPVFWLFLVILCLLDSFCCIFPSFCCNLGLSVVTLCLTQKKPLENW